MISFILRKLWKKWCGLYTFKSKLQRIAVTGHEWFWKQTSEDCSHRTWMLFPSEWLTLWKQTVVCQMNLVSPLPLALFSTCSLANSWQHSTKCRPNADSQSWISLSPAPWVTLTNFCWIKKVPKCASEEMPSWFLGRDSGLYVTCSLPCLEVVVLALSTILYAMRICVLSSCKWPWMPKGSLYHICTQPFILSLLWALSCPAGLNLTVSSTYRLCLWHLYCGVQWFVKLSPTCVWCRCEDRCLTAIPTHSLMVTAR